MKKAITYGMISIMGLSMVACSPLDLLQKEQPEQPTVQVTETETEEAQSPNTETEAQAETQQEEVQQTPEEMYKEVLDGYKYAFSQDWTDPEMFETNGFNYSYGIDASYLASEGKTLMAEIGYAFVDVNNDGTPELFVGSVPSPESSVSRAYFNDMYTIYDGKILLVTQGAERNLYYIGSDGSIYNVGSGGAAFTSYFKCSLDPTAHLYEGEYADKFPESWKTCQYCLKVDEALYSQGDYDGNYWWEYNTNVTDITKCSAGTKNDELVISEEDAEKKISEWNENAGSIEYVSFENYNAP